MTNELLDKVKEMAPDGSITCREARELAEKLGVKPIEVGRACNKAKIKINACELGCFSFKK